MAVSEPSGFFDDEELDIADYLKEESDPSPDHSRKQGFAALMIGAVGVVYGDIGTSPIYAFREALRPVSGDGLVAAEVLGLLSILIWALIFAGAVVGNHRGCVGGRRCDDHAGHFGAVGG